jgi:hypothetical protein
VEPATPQAKRVTMMNWRKIKRTARLYGPLLLSVARWVFDLMRDGGPHCQ